MYMFWEEEEGKC